MTERPIGGRDLFNVASRAHVGSVHVLVLPGGVRYRQGKRSVCTAMTLTLSTTGPVVALRQWSMLRRGRNMQRRLHPLTALAIHNIKLKIMLTQ